MNATMTVLSHDELVELFTARRVQLAALDAALAAAPRTDETRWQRKLIAHARYSTWLELQALGVEQA